MSLWLLKVAIVGLREKPSLPLRSLRPLREAKFVVKLASDEAHQNRFRRNKSARDRTALDWALAHAVECGGWCPKGRKAEDGRIDPKCPLRETPSAAYIQRTEWNVRDSDATVLFSIEPTLTGGSKKTLEFARKHNKPCLHLCAADTNIAESLKAFVEEHGVKVLNMAGPRASKEPGVGSL